jgi:DNA-directed RNA polymerase subunit K/omega
MSVHSDDEKYDSDNESEVSEVESDDDLPKNPKKVILPKIPGRLSDDEEEDDSEEEEDIDADEESEDEDEEDDDYENNENMAEEVFSPPIAKTKKSKKTKAVPDEEEYIPYDIETDEEDDEEDATGEEYLQKFDEFTKQNVIGDHHPELHQHNHDEIEAMCQIARDEYGNILDPLHQTVPFLTKYERARVLGERAKQLDAGAKPFVEVEADIIDGYLIAMAELDQKKIPFIIKRPMVNGGCEYWKIKDLEFI